MAPALEAANATGDFGLYPAQNFRLSTGACTDCPTVRQALWYFRDETIAVPKAALPAASWTAGVHAFDDVRQWAATRAPTAPADYPPLVWVAAPDVVRHARLDDNARELVTAQGTIPFHPTARIPLNRSYFDASSIAYFRDRALTVRGTPASDGFVARSFWPEAWGLGPIPPPLRTMPIAPSHADALRMLMREEPRGGAQSPYLATTLWQRGPAVASMVGRPVLGFMVNGAQGDDDEAHGGHFALVTGRVQADGGIDDWLVNNFYSLDVESEKGIIAAPLPLDNYLADLNSGQGWYRPTYMVVAVLRDERAAALVQSALNRVFNQFYRHQIEYYHPNQNCASISIDTLRALGWPVPERGPSSRLLAWVGFPFIAIKEMSVGKAKLAFDYLHTDQTRLMPAAALEEIFASLMAMRSTPAPAGGGQLATMLAEDLEALTFLRFPQFPSSRAFGDAPAVTTWEYRTLIPKDPALAQIVPVPPRPFPTALRDPDLLPRTLRPSDYALIVWGFLSVIGIPFLLWRAWRWQKRR
ncbi:MAG: hypothetical protein ABI777_08900 [Betaproteobacteria bacterium]